MDLDLASECFFHFWSGDFPLVKFLNGYLDSRGPVEGQLDRAIGTFAKLPVFKFKLIESHISQHLLILAICLTGYCQLSLLNEWRWFFNSSHFCSVQSRLNLSSRQRVFATLVTLILVTHLPILIQTVVWAIYQIWDLRWVYILEFLWRRFIDNVRDVCWAPLTREKGHLSVFTQELCSAIILICIISPMYAFWVPALLSKRSWRISCLGLLSSCFLKLFYHLMQNVCFFKYNNISLLSLPS